jgi:hypothetical protein
MKDPISELIGRLKEAGDELSQAITAGVNIHSFDDYRRLVGRHEGLIQALDIINDLLTEDNEAE